MIKLPYFRKDRVSWSQERCIWPRRSALSKKNLWGKIAYKGDLVIFGPGDPVFLTYWITTEEFLIGKLRGDL